MGYLDKSTITVDAILTNRGRELLSQGTGTGNFQITKFAVADDEVDYGLYNTAHPLGSNYYGAVIENMPVLEATPDETQIMRYKLVTIPTSEINGSAVIPQIQIEDAAIATNGTVTLYNNETSGTKSLRITPITTYAVGNLLNGAENSYTLIIADSTLATVEVLDPNTGLVSSVNRRAVVANGRSFRITAQNKTGTTSVSIFGSTSGATYNFTLSTVAST